MGLDDAVDTATAALKALERLPPVDAVPILESARFVRGGSVIAVAERGAFGLDGFDEYGHGFLLNSPPRAGRDLITEGFGVEPGSVEDLGGVDIADAGDDLLIEEGDLDGATTCAEPLVELVCRDLQGVGTQTVRAEYGCQPLGREKMKRAQAPHAPEEKRGTVGAREFENGSDVFPVRRFGEEHAAGHARFENHRIARVEIDNDPFAEPAYPDSRSPFHSPAKDTL